MIAGRLKLSGGVSLVGVLLGIAMGSALLLALMLFVTRGFGVSREQAEQVRIVEDARVQIERMSDAIRDARSTDTNADELATLPEEVWLQRGEDFSIDFLVNVDDDSDLERVRYFLDGSELRRGVRDPLTESSASEEITTVARSVRNSGLAEPVPLFRYLPAEGDDALGTPITAPDAVKRVEITLMVDVGEQQAPGATAVSTIVMPRASVVLPGLP